MRQFNHQIRLLKIKSEQILAETQSQLNNKNVEIEVLKEMIKGIQIQLRFKESELVRLNKLRASN
jgi:hypothetical protein